MRAVVHDRYGPPGVLRLEEVKRPVAKDDEVLIRVRATTVTRSDCHYRSATPFVSRFMTGVRRPRHRILGIEMAGQVEAVGPEVREFAVGDRVFGTPMRGAYAEFVCMRTSGALALMPDGMSFEDAAAVCDGAILALNALRPVELGGGKRLLVYGASGSIGTAAVQLARHFGAHITAVCNTKNLELVRSLGADVVIDYLRDDFTKNGETYDVIFDAVGKRPFWRCRHSLTPGGTYIPSDGWGNMLLVLWPTRIGDKNVVLKLPPHYRKQDVHFIKELIEAGEYRAVIDRTYPLEDVVEASKYVETQQKTGNVVLTVTRTSER